MQAMVLHKAGITIERTRLNDRQPGLLDGAVLVP